MVIRILITIPVAIGSAYIGLRRIIYGSLGAVGVMLSISAIKGMYDPTAEYFRHFVSSWAAGLISFVALAIAPAMLTIYLGRKAIVRLSILRDMDPIIDSICGAGFGAAMFLSITYIVWR